MSRKREIRSNPAQTEMFGLIWRNYKHPFRLRANDIIRIDGKLCLVVRVNDCAAVVLMNRPAREFITRFDKKVHFQAKPMLFRICSNSEVEILNRKAK